jgi:hypothetical protein
VPLVRQGRHFRETDRQGVRTLATATALIAARHEESSAAATTPYRPDISRLRLHRCTAVPAVAWCEMLRALVCRIFAVAPAVVLGEFEHAIDLAKDHASSRILRCPYRRDRRCDERCGDTRDRLVA